MDAKWTNRGIKDPVTYNDWSDSRTACERPVGWCSAQDKLRNPRDVYQSGWQERDYNDDWCVTRAREENDRGKAEGTQAAPKKAYQYCNMDYNTELRPNC